MDWTEFSAWDSTHSDDSSAWTAANPNQPATSGWSKDDPVLVTDSTKPNIEYMCFWRLTASQWAEKATKVTAVLTVAGSLSDYEDAAKQIQIREAIATSANVHVDQVSLKVTAASVRLEIEIFVEDAATVTSLTTTLTGSGGMLASAAAFQSAMASSGVTMTVEAITVGATASPPPPPEKNDDDGLGGGAIAGIVIGSLAFVAAAAGAAAFFAMKKTKVVTPTAKGVEA